MNPRKLNISVVKVFKRTILLAILICSQQLVSAQTYDVRVYLGKTYYQGDLSPLPIGLSFSQGNRAFGLSVGKKLNNAFSLRSNLIFGKLSGSDTEAPNIQRKRRNLSFESNIIELGISTELNFNALFKGLDKYGINFYSLLGANVYKFNPKAMYNERWVDLQPLGTEGQGIEGKSGRYSLTQLNFSYGIGAKFYVNHEVALGFEISSRIIFTDYLDDVSTEYVGYEELLLSNGEQSAKLANRTGEYLGTGPVMLDSGVERGDSSDNDWYLFTALFASYTIGG